MYRVFYIYEFEGKKYLDTLTTDNYEALAQSGMIIYYVTDMCGEIIVDHRKDLQ